MSKLRPSKKNTKDFNFKNWMDGVDDPYIDKIEMKPQSIRKDDYATVIRHMKDYEDIEDKLYDPEKNKGVKLFNVLYKISSVVFVIMLIAVMLLVVSYLPPVGSDKTPANSSEVVTRYVEDGLQETGAVNIVSGMILTYRAFDTFGETNVLFIATVCVMIMLMLDDKVLKKKEKHNDRRFEPKNDIILQFSARLLCPVIILFGLYIIFNGHLSPGGGFSGGAILGAGMILYNAAFGFGVTEKIFNEKVYVVCKITALCMYGFIGTYFYITGANGIANHIPLGTPGNILSSGIILPINIAVGVEVACTMYAFYALFRRGGI